MAVIKGSILVIALLVCAICGSASMVKTRRMVNDVNSKLPPDQQFSPLGWYYTKHRRLLFEYRRLYPDGKLIDEVRMLSAGVLLLPIVGAAIAGSVLGALFLGIVGGLGLWLSYKP
jgi:hypothetical protein